MSAEKMTRFSKLLRPAIFVFAFLIHVAVIFIFNFQPKEEEIDKRATLVEGGSPILSCLCCFYFFSCNSKKMCIFVGINT